MPVLRFTIEADQGGEGTFKKVAQRHAKAYNQAFNQSQKSSGQTASQTQEFKNQEEALKELRRELRRKISLVDADLRLGNATQEQAEQRIKTIKQEMEAQGAFNREFLVGAQNLKTLANAQNRAKNNFQGIGAVTNRANQVLFDLNQGLQDIPFGMRGIGNNIPFVVEGFRRFGKAAREEGISPLRGFLRAMRSPAGLIGTAAAVIPTILTLTAQWDQFLSAWGLGQETTEANTEAFKQFNETVKETSELIPGLSNVELFERVNESINERMSLMRDLRNAERRLAIIVQQSQDRGSEAYRRRVEEQSQIVDQINSEISEASRFVQELSDEERERLQERIDELREETDVREDLNELIQLTLTEREKETKELKEQSEIILQDYQLGISQSTKSLNNQIDVLREKIKTDRENARFLLDYLTTLDRESDTYEEVSEEVDFYRERLEILTKQLENLRSEIEKAPDRPFVDPEAPGEDVFDDEVAGLEQFMDRMEARRKKQQQLAEQRRNFALETRKFQRDVTQARLADQTTFTERRIQLEQQLANEITRINNTLGITEIEREKAIFDARKDFMQQTLQLERNVAQQRKRIAQNLSQARQQLQQHTLNALTSLSQAFAEDNKGVAISILAIEKGLAIAQAAKEGIEKAGRAQMLANYYLAQSVTPAGPNPAALAAYSNAQAQVGAIKATTAATIAAIAATGIGEAANIITRGSRSSGTPTSQPSQRQEGFFTTEFDSSNLAGSPTNFSNTTGGQPINITLRTEADSRLISAKAEDGRKRRERGVNVVMSDV